jgi:hypothetical protein
MWHRQLQCHINQPQQDRVIHFCWAWKPGFTVLHCYAQY